MAARVVACTSLSSSSREHPRLNYDPGPSCQVRIRPPPSHPRAPEPPGPTRPQRTISTRGTSRWYPAHQARIFPWPSSNSWPHPQPRSREISSSRRRRLPRRRRKAHLVKCSNSKACRKSEHLQSIINFETQRKRLMGQSPKSFIFQNKLVAFISCCKLIFIKIFTR